MNQKLQQIPIGLYGGIMILLILGGIFHHFFSVYVAYEFFGIIGAIVTFIIPFGSEFFLFVYILITHGFHHLYIYFSLAYLALYAGYAIFLGGKDV